jgi:transposase InsO family protein
MRLFSIAPSVKKDYIHFMNYVVDYLDHPQKEIIEKRLEILKFYDEFGLEATKRAFKKSRSTIFLWKQKLVRSGGKLSSLAPGDRTPKQKRKRIVNPFITEFIINYRTNHPGVDKTTITPSLTQACVREGVKPVSESSVGRIIHDLKERGRLPTNSRVRLNGGTGKVHEINSRKATKKIRRKDFRPVKPGDLVEMDSISIFIDGIKRYLFTGIDLTTRFAFAYAYKSDSSTNGRDFLNKFARVAPFPVSRIQTDNGSEFLKYFSQSCEDNELVHYFNYPHHPQSNGHLERFNRTVQEQFADWNTESLDEPEVFNRGLMEYLIWYNTEKPHRGIGKLPPLRYYLEKFVSPHQSNMLWTLTASCLSFIESVIFPYSKRLLLG